MLSGRLARAASLLRASSAESHASSPSVPLHSLSRSRAAAGALPCVLVALGVPLASSDLRLCFALRWQVFLDARAARVPRFTVTLRTLISTLGFSFVCRACALCRLRLCIAGGCCRHARRYCASPLRLVASASMRSCGACVCEVCRLVFCHRRSAPSPPAGCLLFQDDDFAGVHTPVHVHRSFFPSLYMATCEG